MLPKMYFLQQQNNFINAAFYLFYMLMLTELMTLDNKIHTLVNKVKHFIVP